jgi:hypothetical protein
MEALTMCLLKFILESWTAKSMEMLMTLCIENLMISECQAYFGSSMELKLHEDYVFGLDYKFQVALSKVEWST